MAIRRFVVGALVLATLACTGTGSDVDTGPTGPGFAGGHPADGGGKQDPAHRGRRGKAPRDGMPRQRPGEGGGPGDGGGDRRGGNPPDGSPDRREPAPDPAPAPGGQGITYVGNDTWEVERSKVNAWTNDPSKLGASTQQKSNGVELTNVRSGSDAEALGAKDGDLLQEVNGLSLSSQADLLVLWGQLKDKDSFRVKLKRGADERTQHYEIVK
jgi:hypothetical protein